MILRHFFYYDNELVDSFLAMLEGGLYDEERLKTKGAKSANAGGSVNTWAFKAKLGGSLSSNQEAVRVVRQVAGSQFNRLYTHLENEKAVSSVDAMDEETWAKLRPSELLEIRATLELSGVSKLMNLASTINKLAPLMGAMGAKIDDQNTLDGLSAISQQSDNVSIVAHIASSPNYKFVMKLSLKDLLCKPEELSGEFTVLGKLQRKAADNEELPTGEILPGLQGAITPANYRELEEKMAPMPNGFNMGPMVVTAPAAVLTPVAIYQ